jgi:NTP pyrophosphatase (non-canonical NTP hydrolase)
MSTISEVDIRDFGLDEYQTKAGKYQVPTAPPEERVMGLLEEAGEVAGVFKRLMRGDYMQPEAAAKLEKELGDILWYVARVAADNNWTLSSVAATNLDKLESRFIRNQIMGNGDSR